MNIREAVPDDNDALQAVQARCPQGTDLIVSNVNTPDFFARAKAYDPYKVFIASENDQILGSMACGFRNAVVRGAVHRVAYGFQDFVAPEHRRRGIAQQLHQIREAYAVQQGAELFYTHVMEKNIPAMRYMENQNFTLHCTAVMPALPVYKEMSLPDGTHIRAAQPDDFDDIANLINATWKDFELFEPSSKETLLHFFSSTPGFHMDNLMVLEKKNTISAVLGYMDWSRIMRVTINSINTRIGMMNWMLKIVGMFRPVPSPIRKGDILKQVMTTHTGFKHPDDFARLLKKLNNTMLQKGVKQIFCCCEKGHPLLKSLHGFIKINTDINLYAKSIRKDSLPQGCHVFINGIDM